MNKKALSPVIATVLLISLVLVLAAIIFLWARAFIPETLQKFESPIEDACKSVVFVADYSNNQITIQNNGRVPIQSIQVGIKRGIGSLEYVEVGSTGPAVVSAGTRTFDVSGVSSGDELVIIPVLLGKTSKEEIKAFACGDENAQTIPAR